MGAIAGSWAGLHGPGEKTIEKTGQSGPGWDKGLGVWNRGPGQRLRPPFLGGEAPGCRPGRDYNGAQAGGGSGKRAGA